MSARDVWIDSDSCPRCGDTPVVTTAAVQPPDGWSAFDQDDVCCADLGCDAVGQIAVDEQDSGEPVAYVMWEDLS